MSNPKVKYSQIKAALMASRLPMDKQDIATATGLTQPTVYNLLSTKHTTASLYGIVPVPKTRPQQYMYSEIVEEDVTKHHVTLAQEAAVTEQIKLYKTLGNNSNTVLATSGPLSGSELTAVIQNESEKATMRPEHYTLTRFESAVLSQLREKITGNEKELDERMKWVDKGEATLAVDFNLEFNPIEESK